MTVKKHLGLQRAFWVFAQIFVGTAIRIFKNYHCKITRPKSRVFLALYNHTDDLDPLYMAICLFRHMRYVASSVILQGFAGKVISFLLGPIPRPKAASADETVELMLENLRAGISVGMSAEGNRSWDGETMYISPRTAEVAKRSGAGLVTYRTRGGYLRTPRFAANKRKGPVFGEMVREYSAEELARMSVEEISAAIAKDLYVNAYQDQTDPPEIIRDYLKKRKGQNSFSGNATNESIAVNQVTGAIRYKGKAKAENIESILFICPECKGIGTLSSCGDEFYCTCGIKGIVNDYGFLEGQLPFHNTVDWNHWQKAYLKEHAEGLKGDETPIFEDHGADVYITTNNEKKLVSQEADVLFYPEHLEVRSANGKCEVPINEDRKDLSREAGEETADMNDTRTFPLASIAKFGAFRSRKIFFQSAEAYCELSFDHIVSGMKYEAFWRVLTGREYY